MGIEAHGLSRALEWIGLGSGQGEAFKVLACPFSQIKSGLVGLGFSITFFIFFNILLGKSTLNLG